MPSLRELWQQAVRFERSDANLRLYAVVEALVEILEPTHVLNSHEMVAAQRRELARLQQQAVELVETAQEARGALIEAKAEIERLREQRDTARLELGLWLEANKELVADAEIGRLVRNMRNLTRLSRGALGGYLAEENIVGALGNRVWVWLPGCSPNPTQALRGIQEVGDA